MKLPMLRITHQRQGEGEVLGIEGQLVGLWIDEVRRLAGEALARSPRVRLDLGGVQFAGPEGAELIRELIAQGCEVLRSSSFLEEMLRRTSS